MSVQMTEMANTHDVAKTAGTAGAPNAARAASAANAINAAPLFEAFSMPESPVDESMRRALFVQLTAQLLRSAFAGRALSITFLAGAGTRWKASLLKARENPGAWPAGDVAVSFPLDAPRGLFPVPDFIHGEKGEGRIAMAAYAVEAVRAIKEHILVVRGWEREIEAQVLNPLEMPRSRIAFFTQKEGPNGQVSGHGDAALQCMSLWQNARYVVTNFAGDANSPLTVELALRAFAAFDAKGIEIGVIIPVAMTEKPAYPVFLEENGLPAGFWHEKLAGSKPNAAPTSLTNVGIRVYRADWLRRALLLLKERYYVEGQGPDAGWHIPGNDPSKRECALDNVDNLLAEMRLARVMPVSLPRELTPLKSLGEYPAFVQAVKEVQREWREIRRE